MYVHKCIHVYQSQKFNIYNRRNGTVTGRGFKSLCKKSASWREHRAGKNEQTKPWCLCCKKQKPHYSENRRSFSILCGESECVPYHFPSHSRTDLGRGSIQKTFSSHKMYLIEETQQIKSSERRMACRARRDSK